MTPSTMTHATCMGGHACSMQCRGRLFQPTAPRPHLTCRALIASDAEPVSPVRWVHILQVGYALLHTQAIAKVLHHALGHARRGGAHDQLACASITSHAPCMRQLSESSAQSRLGQLHTPRWSQVIAHPEPSGVESPLSPVRPTTPLKTCRGRAAIWGIIFDNGLSPAGSPPADICLIAAGAPAIACMDQNILSNTCSRRTLQHDSHDGINQY